MDGELLTRYHGWTGYWWEEEEAEKRIRPRNLKVGEEEVETTWGRFCILPNVNGQKYTIGKRFTNRGEQGEFIYMSSDTTLMDGYAWVISVENDKFFVSPAFRYSAIFVNNVKVLKKKELKFGDKLSLGNKSNTFLFKERELKPEAFLKFSDPDEEKIGSKLSKNPKSKKVAVLKSEFTPGQNGLILSQILSHLSVKELKSARFVSKIWNEEAFKLLKKRVPLRLEFGFCNGIMGSMMSLFRYSVEMAEHRPLPYWNIFIPTLDIISHEDDDGEEQEDYDTLDGSRGRLGAKLLQDLNFFIFNPNTRIRNLSSVKRLELDGYIASKSEYELRLKLLQALGQGLEELTWADDWNVDEAPLNDGYVFWSNIVFKKLRRFTLSLRPELVVEGDDSDDEDYDDRFNNVTVNDCSKFTWLKDLILAIRGVTTLGLNCSAPMTITFLTQLHANKLSKQFQYLNEITILRLTPAVINLFLNVDFVQPLKKLELYELQDMEKPDFLQFERLLLKHSQSLESLLFIIPPAEDDDEDLPPVFINFPIFPKLERLNVGWGPEDYYKTEDIKLLFSDGSGYINYERDLPCLKSLTLWPLGFKKYPFQIDGYAMAATKPGKVWEYCGSFYEMFLPAIVNRQENNNDGQEVETCKTLQFLDILHSLPTSGERKSLFSKVKETAIASMFPKLETNAWINSIRERDAAKMKAIAKKVKARNKIASTKKSKTENNTTLDRRLRSDARKLRPRSRSQPGGDGAINNNM